MQKVAITRADGSVAVMTFVIEGRSPSLPSGAVWIEQGSALWFRQPNERNIAAEVQKAVPDAVSWRKIADNEVPTDRTYRNALVDDGRALNFDIQKAAGLQLDKLRRARTLAFETLDKDWMIAFASGRVEEARAIEARRQALRDMPVTVAPSLAAARSVEDLKAITLPE